MRIGEFYSKNRGAGYKIADNFVDNSVDKFLRSDGCNCENETFLLHFLCRDRNVKFFLKIY